MRTWLLLAGAIVSEVGASLSLKAATERPGWYVAVAVGYTAALVVLSRLLRAGVPLAVVYGVWGAAGVALTALLSAAVFGEPLTALTGVGIALLVGGVVAVEVGSQQASARRAAQT